MGILDLVASGRRMVATTFVDRALIGDPVITSDGAGGQIVTYVERGEEYPCRFGPRRFGVLSDSDPRIDLSEITSGPAGAAVLFPVDTDVDEECRITNVADGRRWIVVVNQVPHSRMAVVKRLLLREP